MIDTTTTIQTTCSGCMADLLVTPTTVSSNGRRGALHVPAHTVTGDAWVDAETGMILWDCPLPGCDYADSYHAESAV